MGTGGVAVAAGGVDAVAVISFLHEAPTEKKNGALFTPKERES